MSLFHINEGDLSPIKEKSVDLEKDIQKLTEENLEAVFGLKFISSEYSLQNFRIDTIAFDEEASAFVIIEYKRDKSISIIDQGYTYLALMLNNKADFILEYNERTKSALKKDDVDWSQSKVLFLAKSFTTYQQNAINFKDLPIELWEVRFYDNSSILYNQLLSPDSKESIKTITKSKVMDEVSREVKTYTVDDHLSAVSEDKRNLFFLLREKVLSLGDDIEERPKKKYIAYRTNQGFLYVHLQKAQMKLHIILSKSDLNDPKGIARDVTRIGHYGGGITELVLSNEEELPYLMTLIEQSYKVSKK
jgi:predicted transport protein